MTAPKSSAKSLCTNLGFFLIVAGVVICGIANRMDVKNKQLVDDVRHYESRFENANRRMSWASSPEEKLRMLAEDMPNSGAYARSQMNLVKQAHSPGLIFGLYTLGG